MARKKKSTNDQKIKNMILRKIASSYDKASDKAMEIGQRPPYMYTSLCPDEKYRK